MGGENVLSWGLATNNFDGEAQRTDRTLVCDYLPSDL